MEQLILKQSSKTNRQADDDYSDKEPNIIIFDSRLSDS